MTVTVIDDLEVIILDIDSANQLIESNPKFAIEMNYFIEERRKTVLLAQGIQDSGDQNPAHKSRVRSYPFIGQLKTGGTSDNS